MDNCQPEQTIEPGDFTPLNDTGGEQDKEENDGNSSPTSSCSSQSSGQKRKSFIPTATNNKKTKVQTESLLTEIKETVTTLKSLASDNTSKEILEFLKEESQRQASRDDAFLKIMGALVQQPQYNAPVTPPVPGSYNYSYGMTNMRPTSSSVNMTPQDLDHRQDVSFTQQLRDCHYP